VAKNIGRAEVLGAQWSGVKTPNSTAQKKQPISELLLYTN